MRGSFLERLAASEGASADVKLALQVANGALEDRAGREEPSDEDLLALNEAAVALENCKPQGEDARVVSDALRLVKNGLWPDKPTKRADLVGWGPLGAEGAHALKEASEHSRTVFLAEEQNSMRFEGQTKLVVQACATLLAVGLFRFGLDLVDNSGALGVWPAVFLALGLLCVVIAALLALGLFSVDLAQWVAKKLDYDVEVDPESLASARLALDRRWLEELEGQARIVGGHGRPVEERNAAVLLQLRVSQRTSAAASELSSRNLKRGRQLRFARRALAFALILIFVGVVWMAYNALRNESASADKAPKTEGTATKGGRIEP